MAIDPTCGREVDQEKIDQATGAVLGGAVETDPTAGTKAFVDGEWVYYCSLDCRRRHAGQQQP